MIIWNVSYNCFAFFFPTAASNTSRSWYPLLMDNAEHRVAQWAIIRNIVLLGWAQLTQFREYIVILFDGD